MYNLKENVQRIKNSEIKYLKNNIMSVINIVQFDNIVVRYRFDYIKYKMNVIDNIIYEIYQNISESGKTVGVKDKNNFKMYQEVNKICHKINNTKTNEVISLDKIHFMQDVGRLLCRMINNIKKDSIINKTEIKNMVDKIETENIVDKIETLNKNNPELNHLNHFIYKMIQCSNISLQEIDEFEKNNSYTKQDITEINNITFELYDFNNLKLQYDKYINKNQTVKTNSDIDIYFMLKMLVITKNMVYLVMKYNKKFEHMLRHVNRDYYLYNLQSNKSLLDIVDILIMLIKSTDVCNLHTRRIV